MHLELIRIKLKSIFSFHLPFKCCRITTGSYYKINSNLPIATFNQYLEKYLAGANRSQAEHKQFAYPLARRRNRVNLNF